MNEMNLEGIRRAALDQIDKSRRSARRFLFAAAAFEGLMFLAVMLVMDLKNPTHLLIFFCSCLIYGPLGLGLFALRSFIDLSTQRLLRAVELGNPSSLNADS